MPEKQELAVILEKQMPAVKELLGKVASPKRMLTVFLETLKNKKLAECDKESIVASFVKMADLGTDRVGPGGVWLVPYKHKMTVIPDWRLMIQKAKEAKVITHASADVVFEGDFFEYERGLEKKLKHIPAGKSKKMTHAYCVYILPDGEKDFVVMTANEVMDIRDRSAAWKAHLEYKTDCPWVTDPDEMTKKTVIKRTLKVFEGASAPLSKVMAADNEINGFTDLELPEPIAEPKAITAEATTLPPAEKAEVKAEPPAEPEKSQGDPLAVTKQSMDEEKQQQVADWALELSGGDSEKCEALFISWGDFIPTKDQKGKLIPEDKRKVHAGKANVFDYTGKWLTKVFETAEKAYYTFKNTEAE